MINNFFKNIGKKKGTNKICITTYFDDAFSEIGDLCYKSVQIYAKRHHLDAVLLKNIDSDRPIAWNKILVIKKLLSADYDYVIWVDADALFVNYKINIADEFREDRDLYLVKHKIESKEVPNTGIFIIKNSKWSHNLLDMVWEKREYIHHKWWENAAVIDLLGYHKLLCEDQINVLNQKLMKKIKWLKLEWNSLPGICESKHSIIKHYAGRSMEYRLASMTHDFELYSNKKYMEVFSGADV